MGHATTKIQFRKKDGTLAPLTIDNDLKDALDWAKERNKRNWDYVAIVAGLPGSGKSTFAKNTCCPYLCPWFSEKYIAFTDKHFIKITSQCRDYSSVMLDESFAPLNSRLIFTPEFQRIMNHIQIIRQKRLYVFLCLPNFFDLAKGIALFRSSHLFVPYENAEGRRGDFVAFGRKEKKELYVLGSKFMDYQARQPNFHGRYFKNSLVIDEEYYEKKKMEHLLSQNKKIKKPVPRRYDFAKIIGRLRYPEYENVGYDPLSIKELHKIFDLSERSLQAYAKTYKDSYEEAKERKKG